MDLDSLAQASPQVLARGRIDGGSEHDLPTVATHGASRLRPSIIDSYNVELKDDEGFWATRQ